MHKRSFGWIAREIHNAIKQLKVPTYEQSMQGLLRGGRFLHGADHAWILSTQRLSVVPIITLLGFFQKAGWKFCF
jgi:hypothetical protein